MMIIQIGGQVTIILIVHSIRRFIHSEKIMKIYDDEQIHQIRIKIDNDHALIDIMCLIDMNGIMRIS